MHMRKINRRCIYVWLFCLFVVGDQNALAQESDSIWLECSSDDFNQTFHIVQDAQAVRLVSYNQNLSIGFWGEEAINSTFPGRKSLKDFVRNSANSEFTAFNFNRLTGMVAVVGLNKPTSEEIEACKANNGDQDWFCGDDLVIESYDVNCSKIEQKF